MKRDFDLIRQILLAWEASENATLWKSHHDEFLQNHGDVYRHHLRILNDRGLIDAPTNNMLGPEWARERDPIFGALRLTWDGHDFLDSIRDDEIWRKTKDGAKAAGGFTFDILKDLAKSLIMVEIKKQTGL